MLHPTPYNLLAPFLWRVSWWIVSWLYRRCLRGDRMELASVVVYVEDGAVPAALEFYERALGLTRRFYDPSS